MLVRSVEFPMNMFCPRCGQGFEQRLVCPKCKVRLNLQTLGRQATMPLVRLPDRSKDTPWSRILIGLLLAQGIYFGLKQLCMAGLLVTEDEPATEMWTMHAGPALVLALQAVGLLLGGIVAGAGQKRGPIHGFVIGTINALVFIGVLPAEVPKLGMYSFVIEALSLAFIGIFSGWVGKWIWQPLQEVALQFADLTDPRAKRQGGRRASPLAGPIAWFRVLVGVAISVPGSIWAWRFMLWASDASNGALGIDDFHQMRLCAWMVTATALLIGSTIAGSNVHNSLKQGLCLGLATILIVVGHRVYFRGTPPFSWITLTCGLTLGACLLGSWFGGQLLPPLAKSRGNRRLGPLV